MVSREPHPAELASALVGFIDSHRGRFGGEPVCAVLEIPPSTYYAAKKREREVSAGSVRDERLKNEIMRVWEARRIGRRVYGARKVWRQSHRNGTGVALSTVERLMGELRIAGAAARRRRPRTTVPAPAGNTVRLTCWNGTSLRSRLPAGGLLISPSSTWPAALFYTAFGRANPDLLRRWVLLAD
jgi:putative transposase